MTANHPAHWTRDKERGTPFVLTIATLMVRHLPPLLMAFCTRAIVFYFYLTAPKQRRNIARYQGRLKTACPDAPLPARFPVLRQFVGFGELVCDRLAVWQGKIRYEDLIVDDPDDISGQIDTPGRRGQILVCSHIGNAEICRALAPHHPRFKLNVLIHSRHAAVLNGALRKLGADEISLIQVTELDAGTMLLLHQKLEAGEWIAVAADREPLRGGKTVPVRFLGADADLPQGAWLLAALLKAQTNTLFCLRENGRYRLRVRRRKPATAEAFPHIEPERLPEIFRHSFMLVGILERDAAHPELDRIAAEYLRPVTYTDARGWTWTLDKKYGSGHFSATIQWQGEELNLSLHTDGNTLSEHDSALQDCHSFFADYEQHIDSLKEYIAQEMLSTAHELELQQDEPPAEPITATELKHRVSIFSLNFYGNGKFRATLSDDGIFWHHIIDVDGNLDGSYDEVELDG